MLFLFRTSTRVGESNPLAGTHISVIKRPILGSATSFKWLSSNVFAGETYWLAQRRTAERAVFEDFRSEYAKNTDVANEQGCR